MVKLGEVAKERRESIKTDKANMPIVGLEHLIPQQVQLTEWSNDADNTFTKLFHKGDVLFGRRRAYLKKASLAPFDGICSGDITVIAPIENKIAPELLPFIIQNDAFFDYAVEKSAGSLSPRVKWEHLKNYEFELPGLEEQRKLAKILWAAEETKQAYKKLLQKTNDMVKAQFNSYQIECRQENNVTIGDIFVSIKNGATIKQNKIQDGYPITRIETISDRNVNRDKMGYAHIYDLEKYSNYILQDGDILMSHINSIAHLGKSALYTKIKNEKIIHGMNLLCLKVDRNKTIPEFIWHFFQSPQFEKEIIKITKPAVNQASFTVSDLKQISLYLPSLKEQNEFVIFAQQAEQSKQQLQKSLDSLNTMMKALINENLK